MLIRMNKKVDFYYISATSISLCSRKHYQKCYCEAVIITGAGLVGFMKSESECMTASQIKKTTSLSHNIGFPSTINNEQETSQEYYQYCLNSGYNFTCHVTSLSWTCIFFVFVNVFKYLGWSSSVPLSPNKKKVCQNLNHDSLFHRLKNCVSPQCQ